MEVLTCTIVRDTILLISSNIHFYFQLFISFFGANLKSVKPPQFCRCIGLFVSILQLIIDIFNRLIFFGGVTPLGGFHQHTRGENNIRNLFVEITMFHCKLLIVEFWELATLFDQTTIDALITLFRKGYLSFFMRMEEKMHWIGQFFEISK